MPVTMKELAAMAGMSHASVSLVLAGKAEGRVSTEKQRLVHQLAAQYCFRPNAAAQGLRTGKQAAIGILMPAPTSPFYANMVTLLQQRLAKQNLLALFSFWSREARTAIIESFSQLLRFNIAGLISWEFDPAFRRENIPVILYSHRIVCNEYDHVLPDFITATRLAVQHLAELGHSRFGFIGNTRDIRARELKEELAAHKFAVREDCFIDNHEPPRSTKDCADILFALGNGPTALIFTDDMRAAEFHAELLRRNRRIPQDYALLSTSESSVLHVLTPQLSSCAIAHEDVADTLIERLSARLAGDAQPPLHCFLAPKFFPRGSSAGCRAITNQGY